MLSRKTQTVLSEELATIIGKNTSIKGVLTSMLALRIDGAFEGEVTTSTDLVIGDSASVKAVIFARNAAVEGIMSGNMTVRDNLSLSPTAKMIGDIKATSLVIDEGALFNGRCDVGGESD